MRVTLPSRADIGAWLEQVSSPAWLQDVSSQAWRWSSSPPAPGSAPGGVVTPSGIEMIFRGPWSSGNLNLVDYFARFSG